MTKTALATIDPDDLLEAFKHMTLLELSAFVKRFEETFGVTASAPVQQVAVEVVPPLEVEEQTEFTVTLEAAGSGKIQVIKVIREIKKDLGLKEAKDFVDAAPKVVLENASKADAERAKELLEKAGATVSVR